MKVFSGVVAAALIAAPMMFSTAASADEATFKAKCAGCHGPTGMGTVGPRLAGQQKQYIVDQFKLIRDGQRASGKSPMMKGAVAGVTDEQAASIADFLAAMK